MTICENCGKKGVVGRHHKHKRGIAGKRWLKRTTPVSRVFGVNLQNATVLISGKEKKMKLCTSCISKFKKLGKIGKKIWTTKPSKRPQTASK